MMFQDVMIDVETTGTDPTHHAMIQLAAVKFDYATATIDTSSMFNRCLTIPGNRHWEQSTRDWWRQQPDVLASILARGEDPATVMREFASWSGSILPLRMWAKPISFEFPLIQSYARQFGVYEALPYHFRDAIDLQSYIRGMRCTPSAPPFDKEVPFDGPAHDAIYDVIHQIAVVFAAKAKWDPTPNAVIIEGQHVDQNAG